MGDKAESHINEYLILTHGCHSDGVQGCRESRSQQGHLCQVRKLVETEGSSMATERQDFCHPQIKREGSRGYYPNLYPTIWTCPIWDVASCMNDHQMGGNTGGLQTQKLMGPSATERRPQSCLGRLEHLCYEAMLRELQRHLRAPSIT